MLRLPLTTRHPLDVTPSTQRPLGTMPYWHNTCHGQRDVLNNAMPLMTRGPLNATPTLGNALPLLHDALEDTTRPQ